MIQSNELSFKREVHYVCRKFLHTHLRQELCFNELLYFLTKRRLPILKELHVGQSEEQRMVSLGELLLTRKTINTV